ncbi:16S rRNA processing protein RimM [Teredinibacter turnerae T7901]|uniref:Ribosome maturation factor RimM n=1 Tax=Teredinibacter turnerae (strain ATCC 39867 / T7901) TaxID=377629 RepID=C5BR74_TERTT|nr:ribosome maturation factor RimM [Teredinibacter turnerae]ACR12315.1 16S rRNA processing protein RimM [Teredinibacter turnerae T7901]
MTAKRSNLISVGRLTGVFGIKGWIKVKSFTSPEDNILQYSPWWLKTRHGVKPVEIDGFEARANGIIVHLPGVDDRDEAALLTNVDIAVEKSQLPQLGDTDFYWHELVGLRVKNRFEGQECDLGVVKELLETGANDVLVVVGDDSSADRRERLIPYVWETYVLAVDLERAEILVSWDPAF